MIALTIILSVVILLCLVNLYRWSTVRYLKIEGGVLYVSYSRLLRPRLKKTYLLSEVDFIYRSRLLGRDQWEIKMYPQSIRGNVLTVFHRETALFDLEPKIAGWTDYGIRQVALDLKHNGVKQVKEKYGDQDVALE